MDRRILSLSHSHYTICSVLYRHKHSKSMYFYNTDRSFISQHDL